MIRQFSGFFLLITIPNIALAHSPIPGINNFYNGLLHPVLVPGHLLLLIAIGLFFGQNELKQMALLSFLISVLIGLVCSGFSPGSKVEIVIMVWAVIIGLLIAISPKIAMYWYIIFGAIAGFSLGFDSAQESLLGKEKFISLLGSGVGIYFFSLYPIGFAEYCNKKNWQRIGIRVLGSWIAASALLVLALSFSTVRI